MEIDDVFLEAIIWHSIRVSKGFLGEFGELKAGIGLGIEGVKGGVEVLNKLVKGLISSSDCRVLWSLSSA